MKIIGVSGGSGAGKSTVSEKLEEMLPNSIRINGDFFMHQESEKLEEEVFKKLGIKKDKDVFSYNYFLDSFDNVKVWVDTMKDSVINRAKEMIEKEYKDKEYVIFDWVFLPMCDYFKNCDYTICVNTDYEKRLERLTKRLQDKTVYNDGDRSFWSYKPGVIEKRLKFTELNKLVYDPECEIENDGNMEELDKKIKYMVKCIENGEKIKDFPNV